MSVKPYEKPRAAAVLAGELIQIQISVNTGSILANPQVPPSQVIFMTDNNVAGGSTGEGTFELNTACHVGDTLQWRLAAQDGATPVQFLAMKNSNGNVFGFNPPTGNGTLYQGEAVTTGQETYQVLILVNGTTTYSWDPFITCS